MVPKPPKKIDVDKLAYELFRLLVVGRYPIYTISYNKPWYPSFLFASLSDHGHNKRRIPYRSARLAIVRYLSLEPISCAAPHPPRGTKKNGCADGSGTEPLCYYVAEISPMCGGEALGICYWIDRHSFILIPARWLDESV